MALQKEIWINDIQENLYVMNPWMLKSKDDSAFVAFKTVHIPQSGAASAITKNNTSWPLTAVQRTDTDFTYNIDDYSTGSFFVTNFEELQLSYDKRASIFQDYNNNLSNAIANNLAYNWSPSATASRVVRTTGATVSTALAEGATGVRNAITLADIVAAKSLLDKEGIPAAGRVIVMPTDIYNSQFLSIANISQFYQLGSAVLPDGVVNRIYGFDIYIKPIVATYDSTGIALKAVDADGTVTTPATTDNLSCLCYHPDFVSRAVDSIEVFLDSQMAGYQGDVMSARVTLGGKYRRTDFKGVVSIVQA